MTTTTAPRAIDLLVELNRLGVIVTLKGDRIGLQPASRVPAEMLTAVRDHKVELLDLLADPRCRWKEQAEALLAAVDDPDLREDLRHIFDEREAIVSVDGGLGDDEAGRLAYEQLAGAVAALDQQGEQTSGTRT
jgi:hypothetical protein